MVSRLCGTTFPIVNYLAIPLGYAGNNNIPVAAYRNSSSDPIHFVIYDGTAQNFVDAAKTGTAAPDYTTVQVGYAGAAGIPVTSFINGSGNLVVILYDATAGMFTDAENTPAGVVYKSDYVR